TWRAARRCRVGRCEPGEGKWTRGRHGHDESVNEHTFVTKACSTKPDATRGRRYDRSVAPIASRYRCTACGNLTRFDVVTTRRTRAFHHYNRGGDLEIEEEDVLDERVEQVTCRWCNASGAAIETVDAVDVSAEERPA